MELETCFFVVLYFWGVRSLQNVVLDPIKKQWFLGIALIYQTLTHAAYIRQPQGEHLITDMPQMAKRASQLSDIDHPGPQKINLDIQSKAGQPQQKKATTTTTTQNPLNNSIHPICVAVAPSNLALASSLFSSITKRFLAPGEGAKGAPLPSTKHTPWDASKNEFTTL